MDRKQQQFKTDYLRAYKAANGQEAKLVASNGGFVVVAQDGRSTGITYSETEIIQRAQRLRERAAQAAA